MKVTCETMQTRQTMQKAPRTEVTALPATTVTAALQNQAATPSKQGARGGQVSPANSSRAASEASIGRTRTVEHAATYRVPRARGGNSSISPARGLQSPGIMYPERAKVDTRYKQIVVDLSGKRSGRQEKHIETQELAEKLAREMQGGTAEEEDSSRKQQGDERENVDHCDVFWNLSPPEFIFNFTGTADPREKPTDSDTCDAIEVFKEEWPEKWYYKRLKDYITQVVFGIAVEKKSCWIMDGGTKAGIMAFLGSMHKKHFQYKALHSPQDFPLIGFSDFANLIPNPAKTFLGFKHFEEDKYCSKRRPTKGKFLPDPNHTHHVHVLTTGLKCGEFAHEHHFLLRLHRDLAKKCPIVCLPSMQHFECLLTRLSCPRCCRRWRGVAEEHSECAASKREFSVFMSIFCQ